MHFYFFIFYTFKQKNYKNCVKITEISHLIKFFQQESEKKTSARSAPASCYAVLLFFIRVIVK